MAWIALGVKQKNQPGYRLPGPPGRIGGIFAVSINKAIVLFTKSMALFTSFILFSSLLIFSPMVLSAQFA